MRRIVCLIPVICLTLTVIIGGCWQKNDKTSTSSLRIALLKGPSAMAFISLSDSGRYLQDKLLDVDLYDSPAQIQALMTQGMVDIAVLPMALAANLYNKGVDYSLLGCPVWGNLFWISKKGTLSADKKEVYIFGQGSTPDLITRYLQCQESLISVKNYHIVYTYNTPQEIVRGLWGGIVTDAVLPEPFVSMSLHKDSSLYIRYDLAELFSPGGFPQTAVLLRNGLRDDTVLIRSLDSLFKECTVNINEYSPDLINRLVEKKLISDTVGVKSLIRHCRIIYRPASFICEDIADLMNLLYLYQPKSIGGKIPDKEFIIYH